MKQNINYCSKSDKFVKAKENKVNNVKNNLELSLYWLVSGNNCCHSNTFSDFWMLNLMVVPHSKPIHRCEPNFSICFTKGSRADLVWGSI